MVTNPLVRAALAAILATPIASGRAFAADKTPGDPTAPMGSLSYMPSGERPVGWRGDGTGRFPAADPPTHWGRTVKGSYAELRCRAGKPQGTAKAGELLNMGFLRDWVILGPFDVKDFKAGVDEEILKGETVLQPRIARSSRIAIRSIARYCGRRRGSIRRNRAPRMRFSSRSDATSVCSC